MSYDFREGKKRIEEILKNTMEIKENDKLPNGDMFTFDNGYRSWITSLFVDIRKSSEIFQDENSEKVSKMIRAFTSEIIEILRESDLLREIGIRGDCVYAIYTTPEKKDVDDIFYKACMINTYIKMLNELLVRYNFKKIKVGIGLGTAKELVIKAGRKQSGINSKVWIGNSVTEGSNLSGIANKEINEPIGISEGMYCNLNDHNKGLCTERSFYRNCNKKTCYGVDAVITDFNNWINEGMK